jgi:DNA-binding response OmpR family regulator
MASLIELGNLAIDHDRYEVWAGEQRVELTFVEFELLFFLARNADKVMPRERIVEAIWGEAAAGYTRTLTVHISRLRKKLRDSHPWRIRTLAKRGYGLTNTTRWPQADERRGSSLVAAPASQHRTGG